MSEQIREQVSAFLDGELPSSETELLLKRLTRGAELRESFGRYALIGEALRRARPDARQPGELGDEVLDGRAEHGRPLSQARRLSRRAGSRRPISPDRPT